MSESLSAQVAPVRLATRRETIQARWEEFDQYFDPVDDSDELSLWLDQARLDIRELLGCSQPQQPIETAAPSIFDAMRLAGHDGNAPAPDESDSK